MLYLIPKFLGVVKGPPSLKAIDIHKKRTVTENLLSNKVKAKINSIHHISLNHVSFMGESTLILQNSTLKLH